MANPFAIQGNPTSVMGMSPGSYFGEDDDAFSGNPTSVMGAQIAAAAENAAKGAALKQAMANQLAGGADRIRYQPLAVTSAAALATGIATTITANPQRPFRAERLIINSNPMVTWPGGVPVVIANSLPGGQIVCPWIINSILVGVDNQTLSTAGALPGSMFAPNAVATSLKMTTAIPGIGMSLNVSNLDTGTQWFYGALLGTALG